MCLQPRTIKNPNYGSKNPAFLLLGRDTTHKFMEIPCKHCEQCIASQQNDFVQRVQAESEYNHIFFATLTYDNAHLPRLTVDVPVPESVSDSGAGSLFGSDSSKSFDPEDFLTLSAVCPEPDDELVSLRSSLAQAEKDLASARSSGNPLLEKFCLGEVLSRSQALKDHVDSVDKALLDSHTVGECLPDAVEYKSISFAYADIHDVQLLLKNVRDHLVDYPTLSGRNLRYAAVSELGKANGRPHFHILFFLEKRDSDYLCSSGSVDRAYMRSVERQLYTCVRKYWAENVGTRKFPVYVPRFTYARKWSFGKVYTNYDLHWVCPSISDGKRDDGISNVGYYVSKYILKGSERDVNRQRFLRLNLSESEYLSVWSTIKCRMLVSKGFGLDARFMTVSSEHTEVFYPSSATSDYSLVLSGLMRETEDLPDFSVLDAFKPQIKTVLVSRRIMVPNFDLAERLRRELSSDCGDSPGPVFISPDGVHRPLSHYYQTFSFIYSLRDAVRIVTSYHGPERLPATKEECETASRRVAKRVAMVDKHSGFDSISSVDMPLDDLTLVQDFY